MESSDLYRGYRVTPLGTFPMYKVQAQGSGTVPKNLAGTFTNQNEAKQAIDRSLDGIVKKRRGKSNGKEAGTSSGK